MTIKNSTPLPDQILIIEDQRETSVRLQQTISKISNLHVCGIAHDLDAGLNALYDLKPRLVLTDLGLPDGSGIEIIKAAAHADWHCDSLVISIFGDEYRVLEAISAGAKGYILKNSDNKMIGEDIQTVLSGGCPLSPQIAHYLLSLVKMHHTPLDGAQMQITLTDREQEILADVARGYKRAEIGEKLNITVGTVGNHINRIYKKLEVGSNIEAISKATKLGFL